MTIALWTVQAVLAAMFAVAGISKSTQPKDRLAEKLPWVADFSLTTVRVIGVAELAAAVGLILPALTGVVPVLTPLAATGLVVVMALAALTHARRKEPGAIVFNTVLLLLAAFVAWGRFGPYSF
ncbi:DoxX family protein [Nocardiopsis synnemataformans]|uniref:DoxX family protein n=1 Tax=Nocardiopsis synnemataformans TaxID=61305 RepID=UPI003EBA4CA2